MACRYLERRGDTPTCLASDPLREPTLAERRALCEGEDCRGCAYYRFRRASGRALRVDDQAAWARRQAAMPPVEMVPVGRPLVLPTMMPLRPQQDPRQPPGVPVDVPGTLQ